MDELISKTLQKIKEEHIKPVPAWKLSWHNYFFWLVFLLMIVLAAVSFAMVFHLSRDLDWAIYEYVKKSRIEFLISVLPAFWLLLLAVFALISYKNLRFTRHGYRYSRFKIAGITIGISLGLGTLLGVTEAENQLGKTVSNNLPNLPYVMATKEQLWMQPERGLLSGRIVVLGPNQFDLVDFGGNIWNVTADKDTVIRPAIILHAEDKVKVIGDKQEAHIFHAKEIRPWECREIPDCKNRKDKDYYKSSSNQEKDNDDNAKESPGDIEEIERED